MSANKNNHVKSQSYALTGFTLSVSGVVAWLLPLLGALLAIAAVIFCVLGYGSRYRGLAVSGLILATLSMAGSTANYVWGMKIISDWKKNALIQSATTTPPSQLNLLGDRIGNTVARVNLAGSTHLYTNQVQRGFIESCQNNYNGSFNQAQVDIYCGCILLNIQTNYTEESFRQIDRSGTLPEQFANYVQGCTQQAAYGG